MILFNKISLFLAMFVWGESVPLLQCVPEVGMDFLMDTGYQKLIRWTVRTAPHLFPCHSFHSFFDFEVHLKFPIHSLHEILQTQPREFSSFKATAHAEHESTCFSRSRRKEP